MKKGRRSDVTNLVLFTQLGLSVISPIAVCVIVGLILQKYAGMPSFAMVFFILFGLASGISSAWRMIKRMEKISAQNDLNSNVGKKEESDDGQSTDTGSGDNARG